METMTRRAALAALAGAGLATTAARAATREEIDAGVDAALAELTAKVAGADVLLAQAKGVLVMPRIVKGGLIVGGAYGEGALRVGGVTEAYYSVAAASFGLQAGAQASKQAILFMTDEALAKFRDSKGWEAGVDASVTVIDQGLATSLDTTTRAAPVIGIVFGETGLLAGASIQGGKYTKLVR
jgi:lipid-binding SYLF domain-containing protein